MQRYCRCTAGIVLILLSFAGCDSATSDSGGGGSSCIVVEPNGWVYLGSGGMRLTTDDPISDSGNYYYDSYCVDVSQDTWYDIELTSYNGYWIGISYFEADGTEIELLYTDGFSNRISVYSPTSSRTHLSVWIHRNELGSGVADYQFYIAPTP
jgi:hypothetical protein